MYFKVLVSWARLDENKEVSWLGLPHAVIYVIKCWIKKISTTNSSVGFKFRSYANPDHACNVTCEVMKRISSPSRLFTSPTAYLYSDACNELWHPFPCPTITQSSTGLTEPNVRVNFDSFIYAACV